MTHSLHPSIPPEGCLCASFWTVRGTHKKDCPLYSPNTNGCCPECWGNFQMKGWRCVNNLCICHAVSSDVGQPRMSVSSFTPAPQDKGSVQSVPTHDHIQEGEGWIADFVEKGAALEHVRWAAWQSHLHNRCDVNQFGNWVLRPDDLERWRRQINTPYKYLSEDEKESDRKEVLKYLPLVSQLLKEAREEERKKCGLDNAKEIIEMNVALIEAEKRGVEKVLDAIRRLLSPTETPRE